MRAAALDAELAEHLLTYVTEARWFAGKGRRAELTGVTPLPWLTELGAWPAVRSEVAEIGYSDGDVPEISDGDSQAAGRDGQDPALVGRHELYQLVVGYYRAPQPELHHAEIGRFTLADLGPVVAYDAAQDPAACRVLLRLLLDQADVGGPDQRVRFHLGHAGPLTPDLEPRVYTGQQSNTSVVFGDVGMVKLFRRLEIGRNLDIEVHDALARSGVGDVADLYGWVEASWTRGADLVRADLAMAVEKLAQAEDGWALALDALQHGQAFTEDAHALGVALAEIHHALRSAFPTARTPGAEVAAGMARRLAAAAAAAPALQRHVAGLVRCFDTLGGSDLEVQRVHGDFHLGQTLRTSDGWKIIDFEGEPAKSLAERGEPDDVWRDIAGMLRSFDYAAASVPRPEANAWAQACREAFLRGYTGGRLTASDAATLRAYEADKAVYEVVYETRNRPGWVGIPLAAVAALLESSQPALTGAQERN